MIYRRIINYSLCIATIVYYKSTHFRLSLWLLYSSIALGGIFKTLLRVSLILAVVPWSEAVLFQTDIVSSYIRHKRHVNILYIILEEINLKPNNHSRSVTHSSIMPLTIRRSSALTMTVPLFWHIMS